MRPGVVRVETYAPAKPLLCRQKQRVVASGAPIVEYIHWAKILPILGIRQKGEAALVCVRGRIASSCDSGRAGSYGSGNQDRGIELLGPPDVNSLRAEVRCRGQPAISKLVLERKIP